jgi:Tfp pilus assembly protein PilW
MIALAIAGIVAVATLGVWQKSQEAYFRGSDAATAQQETRTGQQLLVREIRQAASILTAEAGRIVFESAADPDPAPARTFDVGTAAGCALRCLRYDRGDGAGPQLVADNLVTNGLQLVYRDAAGAILAAPVSAADRFRIRSVDVTVQGQMSLSDPDPPFRFSTGVKLRNR